MADVANTRTTARASLEEGVQKLGDAGHEAALTAVGLVALGVEGTQKIWRQREVVLEKAQTRGVALEDDVAAFMQQAEGTMIARAQKIRTMREEGTSPRKMVNMLAHRLKNKVESKLGKHGIRHQEPEYQDIEITVAEVEDAPRVSSQAAVSAPATATGMPLPTYDAMTAKEIITACSALSFAELNVLYEYESQNKQRKTILRAVERRLASFV